MDAERALQVLRRWWLLVAAGTLVAAVAAYGVSKAQPKVYTATALLQVNPGLPTAGGGDDFNAVQAAWYQAADDARLIDTTSIAQAALARVGRQLAQPIDAPTLLKDLQAAASPQSRVVTVAVKAGTPRDAVLLANAVATSYIAYDVRNQTAGLAKELATFERMRQAYNHKLYLASRQNEQLLRQHGALSPAQQAQGEALSEQIATDQNKVSELQADADSIRMALAGPGSAVSLAQSATPPTAPTSPRAAVDTAIAAVLAFLVLAGLVLLADAVEKRPYTPADVAAAVGAPLLATLSPLGSDAPGLAAPASRRADEYRALRATLARAGADGSAGAATPTPAPTGVVLVADAGPGDEAAGVAANLAATAARAGLRVALVDANLRRPALHALVGSHGGRGLAELLQAGGDPEPLLHETGTARLRLLAAGHEPAGAIDLLGSAQMGEALRALRAAHDLVVMASAPAASADALALAPLADATLLAARLPGAGHAELAAAGEDLRRAGARLAGVVVALSGQPAGATARRVPTARHVEEIVAPDAAHATRPDLRDAKS